MKITKDMVGKKVKLMHLDNFTEIKYVGEFSFFGLNKSGSEEIYPNKDDWELFQEPKKSRLMALAIEEKNPHSGAPFGLSSLMYSSEQEAKNRLGPRFYSWPAIPNKDGFYEVPEE